MLRDLVSPGDAQVHSTLADEGGYVRGGQEDECDVMILDQGDVEACLSPELDIATGQEVERCLLQSTLCDVEKSAFEVWSAGGKCW